MTAGAAAGHAIAPEGRAVLLAAEGVSRTFDEGAIMALNNVDFAVRAGEFVALTGPSGSGKTCLVHILAGLDLPTAGRVCWRGRPVARQRDWSALRRSAIGIVFQDYLLLPALTTRENVEIAMSGMGLAPAARGARAVELLDRVGLSHRLDQLPHKLSGGERQRVAIARSIANTPELLLCDEPTGNLDSRNSAAIVELLLALRRARGIALVLVTHDPALAATSDRRIAMIDGRSFAVDARTGAPWTS